MKFNNPRRFQKKKKKKKKKMKAVNKQAYRPKHVKQRQVITKGKM